MKKNKEAIIANWVVFLLFSITCFLFVSNRELWRDEAQSWLLVRDLSLVDLFKQLRIEGHPCVWYLVLKFVFLLGLPYKYSWIVPLIISMIAAFIFLKKSPYNSFFNFLFLFCSCILACSAVLVRSYCLVFLYFVLAMVFYKERKDKPILYGIILLLLANTHVLALGFVGCMLLIELYNIFIKKESINKIRRLIGCSVIIVGILLVILQLYGAVGASYVDWLPLSFSDFIYRMVGQFILFFKYNSVSVFIAVIMMLLFFVQLYFFIENKKHIALFILFGNLAYQLFVFTFIYTINSHLSCFFIFVFLFCIYITYENYRISLGENRIILFGMLFMACSLTKTIDFAVETLVYDNKNVTKTVDYVKKNISSDERIYCVHTPICSSLIPYLEEYTFININSMDEFTFVDWKKEVDFFKIISLDTYDKLSNGDIQYFIKIYSDEEDIYLDKLLDEGKIKLIFSAVNNDINDEKYEIYEVC